MELRSLFEGAWSGALAAAVAAGAVNGHDPSRVSRHEAAIAHQVAGALAGVLYAILTRSV